MRPEDLMYTEDHEWISDEGSIYVVGITRYAADELGEVTYVELPELDTEVEQHDEVASVESVKAAGDLFAPVSGTIVDVNDLLEDMPELINQSPYDEGWFFKMENIDLGQLNNLMNHSAYQKFVADSSEE